MQTLVVSLFLASVLVFTAGLANAQQATGDGLRGLQRLPDLEEREEPEFLPDTPTPDFELPPLQPLDQTGSIAAGLAIHVSEIEVSGNTGLDTEIDALVSRYRGRVLDSAQLQQLRQELTLLYISRGFVNSGALLPDQTVSDGVVQFQIIEGRLADIKVTTSGRLRSGYVQRRLERGLGEPLDVNELRYRLTLLQQDPLIATLRSSLRPGQQRGASVLEVEFDAAQPWQLDFSVANNRSPSIGSVGVDLAFGNANVFGFGDALSIQLGKTDGLDDYAFGYSIPLAANGARLGFRVRDSESVVVERPFDEIDIGSLSSDLALDFTYPLWRSLSRSFALNFSLEKRRSSTSLLGRPFSFSPGVVDGRSRVTVLRSGAQWLRRGRNEVLAVRGTISKGFDAWNPSKNAAGPDSEFTAVLGQVQWARRFVSPDWQLVLRGDFQLSADGLLPLEKFAVGGVNSVRGYRENQLVRDNGWIVSAELRMPVLQERSGSYQAYIFVDHGAAANEFGPTLHDSIGSIGGGLRLAGDNGLQFDLALALALRNRSGAERDLQDEGVHFRLSYNAF